MEKPDPVPETLYQIAAPNGEFPRLSRVRFYSCRVAFLGLPASAISIRRRIASERVGLSFWCLAQFSIANLVFGGSRTVRTGSRPVAGRPGFFAGDFSVDPRAMFW
jgi:hypothetical protein